jgi:hypothetical protein
MLGAVSGWPHGLSTFGYEASPWNYHMNTDITHILIPKYEIKGHENSVADI